MLFIFCRNPKNFSFTKLYSCFQMPVVEMERVEVFSASHRLHSLALTPAENADVYGKCNNPNGHGHNYVWRVVLKGEVEPKTGMVYDLALLKKEMGKVMDIVDHKNLDRDVPHFKDRVSTTENVTIFLFDTLRSFMAKPDLLHRVTVEETPKNIFTYYGI